MGHQRLRAEGAGAVAVQAGGRDFDPGVTIPNGGWNAPIDDNALAEMAKNHPATGGLILRSAAGTAYVNPLVRISRAAAADVVKTAAELGMTPTARARLGTAGKGKPEPDAWAGLIGGVAARPEAAN